MKFIISKICLGLFVAFGLEASCKRMPALPVVCQSASAGEIAENRQYVTIYRKMTQISADRSVVTLEGKRFDGMVDGGNLQIGVDEKIRGRVETAGLYALYNSRTGGLILCSHCPEIQAIMEKAQFGFSMTPNERYAFRKDRGFVLE